MSGDSEVENCNGFRFCKECGKLCIPLKADPNEQNVMLFKCETCGNKRCLINLNVRDDKVIKKTQILQSEAADIKNKALGEDPSMPRKTLYCKYCMREQEIVYYFKAGIEEKNIVIQYICKETGYSWTSDDMAKWKRENTIYDPLPQDFKLEEDEYREEEIEDADDAFYAEGSESGGNKKAQKEDDIDDEIFANDDIFADDNEMNDLE